MKKSVTPVIVVSLLLWSVVQVAMVFVVPVFANMFADFGAKLPTMTRICISVSLFIRNHRFPLLPVSFAALVAISFIVVEKKKKAHLILFPLSGLVAVLLIVVALLLPIFVR
jgi:type IV pilus assembly protein PilC